MFATADRKTILKEAADKLVQKLANTKKYDGLYSQEGIDNIAMLYGFDEPMKEEIKSRIQAILDARNTRKEGLSQIPYLKK